MKTALITGANKGIGFEIAKQLLTRDIFVILTSRDETRGVEALAKLKQISENAGYIKMDVSEPESISEAAEFFGNKYMSLDILINNAGILTDKTPIDKTNYNVFLDTIKTNTLGPLLVIQKFLPFINNNGRIINISSELAVLQTMNSYAPAYSVSKAALNAVTKQFSSVLAGRSIAVNSVCPGWVKTDMGGPGAQLTVEKGAETAVWLASEAPVSITGKLLKNKTEITW